MRHHHDLLNDLFEDVWHLDELLLVGNNRHWCLFISVDNLQDFLNVIDISDDLLELLHDDCFLNHLLHLLYSLVLILHFNNLFTLLYNLLNLLYDDRHFHDLLDNLFNVLVNIDHLGNDLFDFQYFGNLHNNLFCAFNFLYFRNCNRFFHYFFSNELSCHYFLHD